MTRRRNRLGADERARIASWFAGHTATERRSISWHMARRERQVRFRPATGEHKILAEVVQRADWNYAYSVTWTPGTLVIAGDIGDITVNHWQAMATVEGAIDWLDGIELDYLMGKSSAKKEYDADLTWQQIIDFANEEACEAAQAHRREWQRHRADVEPALADWYADAIEALGPWKGDRVCGERLPDRQDYLPEPPEPLRVERREVDVWAVPRHGQRDFDVPDGWNLWHRLQQELCDWQELDAIFTSAGRREIKRELRSRLDGCGAEGAAEFCRDLGLDDYYGAYAYPHRCHVHHAAIQAWVAQVKQQQAEAAELARA